MQNTLTIGLHNIKEDRIYFSLWMPLSSVVIKRNPMFVWKPSLAYTTKTRHNIVSTPIHLRKQKKTCKRRRRRSLTAQNKRKTDLIFFSFLFFFFFFSFFQPTHVGQEASKKKKYFFLSFLSFSLYCSPASIIYFYLYFSVFYYLHPTDGRARRMFKEKNNLVVNLQKKKKTHRIVVKKKKIKIKICKSNHKLRKSLYRKKNERRQTQEWNRRKEGKHCCTI